MTSYTKAEIESLIERFESRKLPKVEWTHNAHLVVAIWYCSKHPFAKALELTRQYITVHNESVGTPNTDTEGYHETITKFWLIVANHFIQTSEPASITELCNNFIQSEKASSSYPLNFYSKEKLFSVEGRHNWVEPDLREIEMRIPTSENIGLEK